MQGWMLQVPAVLQSLCHLFSPSLQSKEATPREWLTELNLLELSSVEECHCVIDYRLILLELDSASLFSCHFEVLKDIRGSVYSVVTSWTWKMKIIV